MAESPGKVVCRPPKARGQPAEAVLTRRRRYLEENKAYASKIWHVFVDFMAIYSHLWPYQQLFRPFSPLRTALELRSEPSRPLLVRVGPAVPRRAARAP